VPRLAVAVIALQQLLYCTQQGGHPIVHCWLRCTHNKHGSQPHTADSVPCNHSQLGACGISMYANHQGLQGLKMMRAMGIPHSGGVLVSAGPQHNAAQECGCATTCNTQCMHCVLQDSHLLYQVAHVVQLQLQARSS
jgi:hypothetical protein